jgi:ABC-type bacteriocin/lantibiotic exporter with double-glycine peptidase domain
MALQQKGVFVRLEKLRYEAGTTEKGTSLLGLKHAAEANGFPATTWRLNVRDLKATSLPVVAFIKPRHFVVIDKISSDDSIIVLDPALGRLRYSPKSFSQKWDGVVLILGERVEPSTL